MQVFGKEPSFDPRTDPIVQRPGAAAARQARSLLPGRGPERRADHRSAEGRLRAGLQAAGDLGRRASGRSAAALVSRNTVSVLPLRESQWRAGARLFLPGRCATRSFTTWPGSPTCRTLGAAEDAANAAPTRRWSSAAASAASGTGSESRRSWSTPRAAAICGPSRSTSTSTDLFGAQERVARAIVQTARARVRRAAARPSGRRPTENLAAHNLYLQGRYHLNQRTRRRAAEGARLLREGPGRGRAVRAGAQRAGRCATACCTHYGVMGPAEVWTKAASSAATAVMLDDRLGGGAHVAGAREVDAGLGLARGRARIPARHQPEPAHTRRRTTGTRPHAWRRWDGSTRRWTKCWWRSRSIRCRRSWRATWP